MRILYLTLFLFCVNSASAQFDMKSYYAQHRHETEQQFLDRFPYAEYLKVTSFIDFKTLQAHRYYLWSQRRTNIGDLFLCHLAERFLQYYKIYLHRTEDHLQIGEAFISPKRNLFNDKVNELYQLIGYHLLSQVAETIEAGIKNGEFSKYSPGNQLIIDRLEQNKIYVNEQPSTWEKVLSNVAKGNFSYLSDRMGKKIDETFGLSDQGTHLSLANYKNYFPVDGKGHAINVFSIQSSYTTIGHCVWMLRPYVKASYLAHADGGTSIYGKYASQRKSSKVYLAATGGFTNEKSQPVGLTMENGNIVNAVLRQKDMDGLVIIYPNGGLAVCNLKQGQISLGAYGEVTPRKSLVDYANLIQWGRSNNATMFQTQLLAYEDHLLINVSDAQSDIRERRILAVVKDRGNGDLHNVIFDIKSGYNLAIISEELFKLLKARNKQVIAMLNLDVGSYNILNVHDDKGNLDNRVKGPTSISKATNLIVYTR
ncbi:MAG: hypothetical protein JXR10_06765 [Cyclobacteriaceae bacterium]